MRPFYLFALLLPLALLASPAAHATSYVMIDDEALYDQAPAIAQVSVLSLGPAPAAGVPAIDYIVVVERLLKGHIAGSTVVVRVAGGVGPDGWGLEIVGAPKLAQGDRAIVFLVPRGDGTYGILHLMLGLFHEFSVDGHRLALRDLLEPLELGADDGSAAAKGRPRDFDRFADWLANGARGAVDYRVDRPPDELETLREAFAVLRYEQRRLRWFEDEVEWMLGPGAPAGSRRLLKEALRAWNPLVSFRLAYGGRSDAAAGLDTFDGLNVVGFGDAEDVLPGRFDCRSGGVVAVGGPWFDPEVTGKTRPGASSAVAIRILGADILLNDGAECLLDGLDSRSQESLMRELGHTLGLGFACGDVMRGACDGTADDSVMRALLHPDGAEVAPGERERRALEPAH